MKLSLADAERIVIDALLCHNVSSENAQSVATALVAAEAAGQGGHGLRRVPAYAQQARAGKVNGHAVPVASQPFPAALRIDAGDGYAYPALDLAVALLPDVARTQGIALAAIHHSHHAGVMGLTVERFAEQGLVVLMVANAPAAMAAWGGKQPLYGTNPIAFAAPVAGNAPIVIDLALSKVARGKIMAARQKNVPIPDDWAFDCDGVPTTDAQAALNGTMVPAGGPKGAALALMVEIMAAGLTGGNLSTGASSLFDDQGPPPGLGHMIIAINPQVSGADHMADRLAGLAALLLSEDGVRLPGRRGQTARSDAGINGIEVEEDVLAAIRALG
ncbi:MAG: Ldh family oxidoreductase [Pseudomonadota bacterium]